MKKPLFVSFGKPGFVQKSFDQSKRESTNTAATGSFCQWSTQPAFPGTILDSLPKGVPDSRFIAIFVIIDRQTPQRADGKLRLLGTFRKFARFLRFTQLGKPGISAPRRSLTTASGLVSDSRWADAVVEV
jgi:hypothetical protein